MAQVIKGSYLGTPVAIKRAYEGQQDKVQEFIDRELSLLRYMHFVNRKTIFPILLILFHCQRCAASKYHTAYWVLQA